MRRSVTVRRGEKRTHRRPSDGSTAEGEEREKGEVEGMTEGKDENLSPIPLSPSHRWQRQSAIKSDDLPPSSITD